MARNYKRVEQGDCAQCLRKITAPRFRRFCSVTCQRYYYRYVAERKRRSEGITLRWPKRTTLQRFMEFVEFAASGCWLWKGSKTKRGRYGKFTQEVGKRITAHRFSYQTFKGPIPEGLAIDHTCSITNCMNPAHLAAVTTAENNRRTLERGRVRYQ